MSEKLGATRKPLSVGLFLVVLDGTTNQGVGCSSQPGSVLFLASIRGLSVQSRPTREGHSGGVPGGS